MINRHIDNERLKHRYVEFLRQADGKSEQTIRQIEKAILRFEEFTHFADFRSFDQKQATAFKADLAKANLALATIFSTLNILKRFFAWLALQSGYKSRIRANDIEYLNLPAKDVRSASSPAEKQYPTLQMVEAVVAKMPYETPLQKRDRALIAFTAITGIRDGALASLKLKHFDAGRKLVLQNPLEVATKFGKRIDTFLFPLVDSFEIIVQDWVVFLKSSQLFADHDPLFPKTAMGHDQNDCFSPMGLSREHWSNASPIRAIFKAAFKRAEMPYFPPHRLRDMIVSEMYLRGLSIAEFKAWSQNLGHEGAMTTLTSYGRLSIEEQGRLVRNTNPRGREAELLAKIRSLVGH